MQIERHAKSAIIMHWVNAFCWIGLLFTGFALLVNPATQPVGEWWSSLWTGIFGQERLLSAHIGMGISWTVLYALFIVIFARSVCLPFLREIFRLSPVQDAIWCWRKGVWLIFGEKKAKAMGLSVDLPKQGFYNAGQKYVAIAAIVCSLGLVATGALLVYARNLPGMESLVQWALLVHLCCAGIMAIALPIHIYMAAAAPGEGPALRSMFTGMVPLDFVQHHNPLWYDELQQQGKISK